MTESVGLSIGATNLAAVTVGRAAVTRPAVLTREPGPAFTDFVDRVGDPVGLIAADGTTHRPEALLTEALRALQRTVPPGRHIGISHPGHWHPRQVAAMRTALADDHELRSAPLLSDAVAALAALSDNPGLPARGIVALCDFGGTGTSITVADAADGYQPVAPTVRYAELSGALIDQAVLTHVLAGVPGAADATGTSAIGSLTRLRAECRTAKERLSGAAAAAVPVDLPGNRTEVRITRDELDAMLRGPLGEFLGALRDTLQRIGIRAADLAAVASVGGGARIPAVTAALSEQFRVPVVTLPQPELAAAIGAGIRAGRPAVEEGVTTVAPVAPVVPAPDPAMSSTFRALAWSQDTDEVPGAEPFVADHPIDSDPSHSFAGLDARPQVQFTEHEAPEPEPIPWYRRPALLIGTGAAVVLAVCVAAAVFVVRTDRSQTPTSQTTTATATANPATPSAVAPQPSPAEAPAPVTEVPPQTRTVTRQAPVTQAPPPPATEAPAPAPTSEAPPPSPAPEPSPSPEPSTEAPTTPPPLIPTIPPIPPIPTIPGLPPFIPQPGQQLPH